EQGVDVSRALHDIFERERPHTETQGGYLTASIQPDLYAKMAAHDLKRVISNLIENARRYGRTPDDDRAYIQLTARQEGGTIAIEVSDQGPGIAESDIHRLLRPFSRGDTARTGGG